MSRPQIDSSVPFGEPLLPTGERGLIWAADVLDAERLFRILDEIRNDLTMVKVGHPLLWACSLQIIAEIRRRYEIPVIADAKLCDVPALIRTEVSQLYEAGADGLLIVGLTGEESVRAAIDVEPRRMVFVFTEFTHADGLVGEDLAEDCARLARTVGAYGIQAPGSKPKRIADLRRIVGNDLKIMCCGIGIQGGIPGSAVELGANYEIVGRAITMASNPKMIARQIRERIGG